uniref:At1g61320/AtMIF1 LRR domain-containing protein n=1 Tax=Hordeum vulgare subsp. vulgare TaxID=112509 RepID=A0A8I6Y685_HORVV
MDHPQIAGQGREDRLSKLRDGVLGHILSFLGTKEAGRAAALSSRWRYILASVHTVSLEEPEKPIPDYDPNGEYDDPHRPAQPFNTVVTKALYTRTWRPATTAASVPLRVLRVSLESCTAGDASTLNHCVAGALRDAGPELHVHLRLRSAPVCRRPDPDHDVPSSDEDHAAGSDETPVVPEAIDDNDDVASSVDERPPPYWRLPPPLYTVCTQLFSSTALRSLSLGSFRLCPPATISLPALRALHLTQVPDAEEHVQRLISACKVLADLTLEACATVTTLYLVDNTCLRRLIVRCCHKLHTVTIDPSELRSLEYRGGVPGSSFLALPGGGGGGFPSITSCKVDICAVCVDEASSPEQLATLGSFLQRFTLGKYLHLSSARMGSCFLELPLFPSLRYLRLHGRVLRDDPVHHVASTNTILEGAPNLEHLTLFFEPPPPETHHDGPHYFHDRKRMELLQAHNLHYNQYDSLDNALRASVRIAPCLRSRVRRISLVHYQGGRAQRMLASFLLRNALLLNKLYCEFAQGPMWIQMELMREMESWVVNNTARKVFH